MFLFIVWFMAFVFGWIFFIFFRKNKDVLFHRISLCLFVVALIVSVGRTIQLLL